MLNVNILLPLEHLTLSIVFPTLKKNYFKFTESTSIYESSNCLKYFLNY